MNDHEAQQKLLNLVVTHQDFISQMLAADISPEHFDSRYRTLVHAVEESHQTSSKFTEDYYIDFVTRSVANGNYKKWSRSEVSSTKIASANEKSLYNIIANLELVDANDFNLILRKVKEAHIKQRSIVALEEFSNKKSQDYLTALSALSEEIGLLVTAGSDAKAATFTTVDDYGDQWYKDLENEITNPKKVLHTGIKPFDETMPMGLDIGSLTLIVADVGGFKSASMINIALNVCKLHKEDVLYVSLEMPKSSLMQRILAREAGIDSEKISKPAMLSSNEKQRLQNAISDFKNISSKFAILDAQERMTVGKIRAELEKRKSFFRPRLVVIDYISILSPETWYQKLAEHSWYGQMCKDLRQLGRKMGFGVLSAVQLNREAIKSLRNQKDGKQTVGSDALRGSHDFSADADNIYVQFPHPDMPKEKLYLFCVKSRNGSTMFGQFKNQNKATLEVHASICKITASVDATWSTSGNDAEATELLKKAENVSLPNPDLDLDFDATPPFAPTFVKPKVKHSDLGFDL